MTINKLIQRDGQINIKRMNTAQFISQTENDFQHSQKDKFFTILATQKTIKAVQLFSFCWSFA